MQNALWRICPEYLVGYVEDPEVIRKIRRSYPEFMEFGIYYRNGTVIARQYRIPSDQKRSARRLLGVNLT
ncbi:hypothetical protein [Paenibacillus sp. 453mf]|uniref:hypothetical protein n=1 Tax=Paenibacillus sp. 453mf TaxID=1761874 RepID=UPI0008EE060C|nr:hypothetical protein [Paenibacillus sp. 453mf]SFS76222.1 hypothetical protein SAMN04488601_10348 [Paenibacillus sp. 453mf]